MTTAAAVVVSLLVVGLWLRLEVLTRRATTKRREVMALLDSLREEVARNTSVDESAKALLAGLAAKIDALAELGDIDALKAGIEELRGELAGSSDALAAAVSENTR